jgi:hypothetical protein
LAGSIALVALVALVALLARRWPVAEEGDARAERGRPDELQPDLAAAARSPLTSDAFQVRGSSRVRETTYLGMALVRSAKPVSSVAVGQKAEIPS